MPMRHKLAKALKRTRVTGMGTRASALLILVFAGPTGHHARLGTRLLAKLYRSGHPRPPNFMRFPRRNTPESRLLR
jgi:hypothetical protein